MKKRKRVRSKPRTTTSSRSISKLGFSGWVIIFLSAAIVTFLGSIMFNQRTAGKSESSFTTVTLQVLNGCGVNGASEEMSRALLPGDGTLVYDIIERDNAEITAFNNTLVIDRRGSGDGEVSEQAVKIAERLDIDSDEIVIQKFDDNILEIDVTIIVGVDYKKYIEKLNKEKETIL
jgi:hypothetical protein